MNFTGKRLTNQRGITLIALVVSVIVLLILAGVSISAITGNESAMEKAKQARTANEQGGELDAIKLAVVSAMSKGTYGMVEANNLKTELTGLVTATSLEGIEDESTGPWTVDGNKASYRINQNGIVTKLEPLNITESLRLEAGAVQEITVTKYGSAAEKAVSWSKSGNVTFVTSLTDATEVANPTGNTVFVKAGAYSSTNDDSKSGTITVSATGEESKSCNITIFKELKIGDTVNYSTTLNGQTLDTWKVFYKDGNYTYIILSEYLPIAAISNDFKTNNNLADGNGGTYTIKSTTNRTDLIDAMATTSNWADLINNGEMNGTALSTAVKSDINVWAMGAPDIELWANSWNSASNGFTTTITTSQNATGYKVNGANDLSIPSGDKSKANYSLYVPHTSAVMSCNGYWLASPYAYGTHTGYVANVHFSGDMGAQRYDNSGEALRPIICLPSSVLNP